MTRWRIAAVAGVFMLAGCARLPVEPLSVSSDSFSRWLAHREQLLALSTWTLSGRMAVRTGERGGTATVLWQRMGDHHQLMLFGPFGGGRVRIVENSAGAELRDNKERVFRGDTAEAVLMEGVGWHVPFRELSFWVRGLPAPGVLDDLILDERGRAAHFSQSGWEVDYRAYREVDNLMLPAKVFIAARPGTVRVTAADGTDLGDQLSVRISIRAWNDEPEWAEPSR